MLGERGMNKEKKLPKFSLLQFVTNTNKKDVFIWLMQEMLGCQRFTKLNSFKYQGSIPLCIIAILF